MMEINGMSCTDCQQQIENEFNQKKIYLEQHLAVLLPKQDASVESVLVLIKLVGFRVIK